VKADRCYTVAYTVPPQRGFFSITAYGPDLYLYSDNIIFDKYNIVFDDAAKTRFTACFGSEEQCGDAPNLLDTIDGRNLLAARVSPRGAGHPRLHDARRDSLRTEGGESALNRMRALRCSEVQWRRCLGRGTKPTSPQAGAGSSWLLRLWRFKPAASLSFFARTGYNATTSG